PDGGWNEPPPYGHRNRECSRAAPSPGHRSSPRTSLRSIPTAPWEVGKQARGSIALLGAVLAVAAGGRRAVRAAADRPGLGGGAPTGAGRPAGDEPTRPARATA